VRDGYVGLAQVLLVLGRSRVDGLHHGLHDSVSKYRIDRDLDDTTTCPNHPDLDLDGVENDLVGRTNRALPHNRYFDESLDRASVIVVDRLSAVVRTRRIWSRGLRPNSIDHRGRVGHDETIVSLPCVIVFPERVTRIIDEYGLDTECPGRRSSTHLLLPSLSLLSLFLGLFLFPLHLLDLFPQCRVIHHRLISHLFLPLDGE
jgi:hypothetical protein